MKQAFIYNELVRFYNRSRRKLHHLVVEGKNLRKQNILQKRIARLFRTLAGMQYALKLGVTTAALSAGMLLFQPNAAQAQISFGTAQLNPFGLTNVGGLWASPAFADLDGDGDMDLMTGTQFYASHFKYFENTGTSAAPHFATGQANPFGLPNDNIIHNPSPVFADLDGDGDLDMMAGEYAGNFFYYQNIGTAVAPAFAAVEINPFGLTDIGWRSAPAFVDLDGDGDLDMMSGENSGAFYFFENIGTATTPVFAAPQLNPCGLGSVQINSTPTFADLDKDGDMDMLSGEEWYNVFSPGHFIYFQNTGTSAAPSFTAGQDNPFSLTDIGISISPDFADLDGDGNMDIMAGEMEGNLFYFENTTSCSGFTVYADADGDAYGDISNTYFAADCVVPSGYVLNSTDCNDNNAAINPGATEVCNGVDDNCNGVTDEGCTATCALPTGLTTSNITGTSAKLKWDAVAGAEGHTVRYKVSGTSVWKYGVAFNTAKSVSGLLPSTIYKWQVKTFCKTDPPAIASAWSSMQVFTTGSLRTGDEALQEVSFQIYPNPASDQATVQFTLPPQSGPLGQSSHVSIRVYDVSGKEIATLLDENLQQEEHSLQFNTNQFSKGVYLVKLISDSGIENQKLIVQ